MKNATLLILATLASSTLIACGGGSGGGSDPTPPTKFVTPPPKPEVNNKPNTSSRPQTKAVTGYYLVGADGNNVGSAAFSLSSDKLEVIDHFDSIPLSDPNQTSTNGFYKIGTGTVNDNSLLQHVRFGAVENDRNVYIFAQGLETKNMPTEGSATYSGHSVFLVANKDTNKLNYNTYPAKFNVDFKAKTLNGSVVLDPNNAELNVIFDADINGNTFEKRGLNSIDVKGKFYGDNASELGGVYLKRGAFSGSFGAKKDEK